MHANMSLCTVTVFQDDLCACFFFTRAYQVNYAIFPAGLLRVAERSILLQTVVVHAFTVVTYHDVLKAVFLIVKQVQVHLSFFGYAVPLDYVCLYVRGDRDIDSFSPLWCCPGFVYARI